MFDVVCKSQFRGDGASALRLLVRAVRLPRRER